MRIEIRSNSILIDGYVNAVGRDSRPIITAKGKCVEQIEPRAFEKALRKSENVDLLLNHNPNKKLGSTKEGNLKLFEDNIGLRAICTIYDKEAIEKARNKELRGWSFGMYVEKEELEERADTIPRRHVSELELFEVSLIDKRMNPCYVGTSIEQRAEEEKIMEQRGELFTAVTEVEKTTNYQNYEERLKAL